MRSGVSRCGGLVLAAFVLMRAAPLAQKGPALADVLRAAGDYLVRYSEQISTVAAEEEFLQYDTSAGPVHATRRVTSDVVLYGSGDGTISTFRCAYAVDTVAMRSHDDRLIGLFTHPTSESGEQARQLTRESVRLYLNENFHVLDEPTVALEFLRRENQARSTFTVESVKKVNGDTVAILKFKERSTPRLIPSKDNGAAVGRFWVDVATGAVRQTELGIPAESAGVRVTVKYERQPALALWLPEEMSQQFEMTVQSVDGNNNMGAGGYRVRQNLEGRATY